MDRLQKILRITKKRTFNKLSTKCAARRTKPHFLFKQKGKGPPNRKETKICTKSNAYLIARYRLSSNFWLKMIRLTSAILRFQKVGTLQERGMSSQLTAKKHETNYLLLTLRQFLIPKGPHDRHSLQMRNKSLLNSCQQIHQIDIPNRTLLARGQKMKTI